ncbi:MAG: TolC family protein [Gemmataceae bacterium]|nr:TolC family protein [Gemmataceae bacterium]
MRQPVRCVVGLMFVAGCASTRQGPDVAPLTAAPPLAAKPASAPANVKQVQHTEAQPAGPISLNQAISICLQSDPKLRAGFETIAQANADALTASLPPNPDMFIDGQLLPLGRPFSPDRPGGPTQQDLQFTYAIDWFLFGKRVAAMASASLAIKVTEAEYADLVRQRVTETAVAYYDVVEAKALVDLSRQDVENLEKVAGLIQKNIDAGVQARVDGDRVRLDLLNSRRVLRDSEAALVSARARLRSKLGRCDSDAAFDVAGTPDIAEPAEPLSVDQAMAVACENRPDLHAVRWKLAQARADVETERRKAYPRVSPLVGWSKQYQRPIGAGDVDTYTLGLTVGLPLCDRNQGNREKAASQVVRGGFEVATREVELRAELESAIADFRTARANADAVSQDQLKLAESVREAINTAYRAGDKPLLDVLDAQRNYRETYRQFITSRANYWRSLARYQSAIGQQVSHGP